MYSRKYIALFFTILSVVVVGSYFLVRLTRTPEIKPLPYDSSLSESADGKYFSLFDNRGQLLLQTGVNITPGDEYYDSKDHHYLVTRVDGLKAEARLLETHTFSFPLERFSLIKPAVAQGNIHVCIYHTHSDESYTPTDGSPSIRGNGSVMIVGERLAAGLRANGISVYHSYARHDPHDINAYVRSRRTVFQLLKQQPDALFDIHRDSAPPGGYYTELNGIPMSKVMLVVGRQNPHMSTNLNFARQIKRQADRLYPGLIKGIIIAHGSYNQDLYPTALLIEIGTETLPRDLAENAAFAMSDVLTVALKQRQTAR